MSLRIFLLGLCCCALLGCEGFPASRPVINSGSYDWTDQVRDARGFPQPGWGTAIFGGGGIGGDGNW
jgi:hypothetical protein